MERRRTSRPRALIALLALPAAAMSEQRPEGIVTGLEHCAAVAAAADRLACYDALARRAIADDARRDAVPDARTTAHTDTGTARAAPRDPVTAGDLAERTAQQNFGMETVRIPVEEDDEPVAAISARIETLTRRPRGEYVFELDDGQRWTQTAKGRARYRAGKTVTIERTALGACMLVTCAGRASGVRRLQ